MHTNNAHMIQKSYFMARSTANSLPGPATTDPIPSMPSPHFFSVAWSNFSIFGVETTKELHEGFEESEMNRDRNLYHKFLDVARYLGRLEKLPHPLIPPPDLSGWIIQNRCNAFLTMPVYPLH